MLTFEFNRANQCLEVFFDQEGAKVLSYYAACAVANKDHYHLKTEEWGGSELSSEQQDALAELVNHVKFIPL